MPKKFAGENSKAAVAKARKNEKETAEKERKAREIEDAKWKDDDKQLAKKQAKKEDQERKRLEALEKKKEAKQLLDQEEAEMKSQQIKKSGQTQKLSRAQIREEAAKREAIARGKVNQEVKTHLSTPLQENINRVKVEGVEARTVDEALNVLSIKGTPEVDNHPEKRMKAAYEEFEEERLPQLKAENPTLRLSQLKQLLRKEWNKHPNNPLNVKIAAMQS